MRLVRVKVVNKNGVFRLIGTFRSDSGRKIRKMLAQGLRREDIAPWMEAAVKSDAIR